MNAAEAPQDRQQSVERKKLEKGRERLDCLAKILEGTNMCSAVCLYNGELLIAANDINYRSGTRGENELLSMIGNRTCLKVRALSRHICQK